MKISKTKVRCKDVDWILLVQGRGQRRTLTDTVMEAAASIKGRKFIN
jgi:hypothetical protein